MHTRRRIFARWLFPFCFLLLSAVVFAVVLYFLFLPGFSIRNVDYALPPWHFFAVVVVVAVIAAPLLLLPRGRRLAYAAMVSFCVFLVVALFWCRSHWAYDVRCYWAGVRASSQNGIWFSTYAGHAHILVDTYRFPSAAQGDFIERAMSGKKEAYVHTSVMPYTALGPASYAEHRAHFGLPLFHVASETQHDVWGISGLRHDRQTLRMPLYALAAPWLILPAVWLWRFIRQPLPLAGNLCTRCSYDLRAHTAGERCPECGTPITPRPEPVPRLPHSR